MSNLIVVFINDGNNVALLPELSPEINNFRGNDGGDARRPTHDGTALFEEQVPAAHFGSRGSFTVAGLALGRSCHRGPRVNWRRR